MTKAGSSRPEPGCARRIGLLLLGIVAGQIILYGASFAGTKILLPLNVLTLPRTYIPMQPGQLEKEPPNQAGSLSDPVFEDEPARLFRHDELHAGRIPMWNPYQYAGVPCESFLSPFATFAALVRSPRILPCLSLLLALVSGLGTYVFARRVLQVTRWPATIAAWCYPLTGFFVLWQSSSLPHPVVWLPWFLYTVHVALSRSMRWGLLGVAFTTMLTLISGHLDMAGLVLVAGGLFAIWDFLFLFHGRTRTRAAIRRFAIVIVGWILGFMLASPELLPALDYAKTGSRLNKRAAGQEERPPIGLASLPQLILPDVYGTLERDSFAMLPRKEPNLVETPAAGFVGLIVALVLAPLAWGDRRHRSLVIFLGAIALLGMAWCLNIPGVVSIMRLPPFNMLSYNRFVFATSFALLALATIGLDKILNGNFRWHKFYYLPVAVLIALGVWCLIRACALPDILQTVLPQLVADGQSIQWVQDMEGVRRVQHWFTKMYLSSAVICLMALSLWAYIKLARKIPRTFALLVGLLALGELLFLDYGRAAQSAPALYYPNIPMLDKIAHAAPGRVVGYKCLPANLLQTQGLFEVRGYDGVDPARLIDLLDLGAAPDNVKMNYAAAQYFVPKIADGALPQTIRLSPILDMLGVRYVIIPDREDTQYYVFENDRALPRVFVPQTVELEAEASGRLAKLGSTSFDPRQVAYVETPVPDLPPGRGEAEIIEATSQRLTIKAKMEHDGLVVLADQWNSGWRAYIDDKVRPIVRVDHALRGVIAPAGESTIVFRYQPQSLRIGAGAALFALLILMANLFVRRGQA